MLLSIIIIIICILYSSVHLHNFIITHRFFYMNLKNPKPYHYIAAITAPKECLCPLGEVLYFSLDNQLLSPLFAQSASCTKKTMNFGSIESAVSVGLNSIFMPKCPALAQLMTMGNSSTTHTTTTVVDGKAGGNSTAVLGAAPQSAPSMPSPTTSSSFSFSVYTRVVVSVVMVVSTGMIVL